jgi:hypothetical protein
MFQRGLLQLMERRGTAHWAIVVLVAGHLLFLMAFFVPAISTPDANGYMAQARLIASQRRSDIVTESPAQYVGDHWMQTGPGHYYGQYPPGLPALLAPVFRLWGPQASLRVIPLLGSLSLLALYLVCREWLGSWWGLLAAALMALNPVANEHAMAADSHTAVCFFLLWGLYCLIRWDRSRSAWWAAGAGFCVGVIPSIRYAEALFLPAFAVFVVMGLLRRREGWRTLVAGITAASVPIVALAIRNQAAFGAFWRTGYSISNEQTAFSLGNFARNLIPYLVMILVMGAGPVVIAGAAGIVTLCKREALRQYGALLAALIVPITLLYMFYYWGPDPFSMRFLLPTFFLYAIAAVWCLQLASQSSPRTARKWSAILLLVTAAWGLPLSFLALNRMEQDNRILDTATRAIAREVEPGSIIIADHGLQQHLDFLGTWKLAPAEAGQQVSEKFLRDILAWAGGSHKIYFVGAAEEIEAFVQKTGADQVVQTVAEVSLPVRADRSRASFPAPGLGKRDAGPGSPFPGPPPGPLGWLFGGPPPPGGPHPPPPGGGEDFPGSGFAGRPHPPHPPHFEPPANGRLVIAQWKPEDPA